MISLLTGQNMKSSLFSIIGIFLFLLLICQTGHTTPLRIVVAGLSHYHAHWVFQGQHQDDILIAGIAEPNRQLAERYARQYGFSMDLVYDTLEEMIDETQPEAVTAFGSIYDHLEVVRIRSEEHTSELQSRGQLVCRLLLEKK